MSDQQFTPYEIDDETFKKMQAKMLEMLLYFKDFCGKHNLMFYLCGGGAIGAIREKGFVPWDDDIDCFMPRSDYCLLYTSPSPRDKRQSRMPSSA